MAERNTDPRADVITVEQREEVYDTARRMSSELTTCSYDLAKLIQLCRRNGRGLAEALRVMEFVQQATDILYDDIADNALRGEDSQ